MESFKLPVQLPVPDEEGYYFLVPPRSVWRKFCEEMDFEGKYIPEPDDFPVIFRRLK